MLNWPLDGNDWHEDPSACLSSNAPRARRQLEAMADHSRSFLAALQDLSGPQLQDSQAYPGGSLALQPYWRESRRLIGQTTVSELMLLPGFTGDDLSTAVAVGNYANDHHYPGDDWHLEPKQQVWGGRISGTPFTIPLAALHGSDAANLLLAEKGFSVSHIANGATRLAPLLLQIGQAAGATAAICHQRPCLPAELPARVVQSVLIRDSKAPVAVAPCADLAWHDPNWQLLQEQPGRHALGRQLRKRPVDGRRGLDRDERQLVPSRLGRRGEVRFLRFFRAPEARGRPFSRARILGPRLLKLAWAFCSGSTASRKTWYIFRINRNRP